MVKLVKIALAFATASLIVGVGTVAGLFWHFSHGLPDHKQPEIELEPLKHSQRTDQSIGY